MISSVKDLYMRCINTGADDAIYKYGVQVNADHKPNISYYIGTIRYAHYYSKIHLSCNGLYEYFYCVRLLYIKFTAYDYL